MCLLGSPDAQEDDVRTRGVELVESLREGGNLPHAEDSTEVAEEGEHHRLLLPQVAQAQGRPCVVGEDEPGEGGRGLAHAYDARPSSSTAAGGTFRSHTMPTKDSVRSTMCAMSICHQ